MNRNLLAGILGTALGFSGGCVIQHGIRVGEKCDLEISVVQEGEEVEWKFSKIWDYNPRIERKKFRVSDEIVRASIERGLDSLYTDVDRYADFVNFEDFEGFVERIKNDSLDLGYKNIDRMSPREAILLANDLVGRRFEYMGLEKWKTIKEKRDEINGSLKKLEGLVEKESDESLKEFYKDSLDKMKSIGDSFCKMEEIYNLSGNIIKFYSVACTPFDELPADKLYDLGGEVICRQYVVALKGVFDVMKTFNPNLINSYVSGYNNMHFHTHIWNQITTISRDNAGKIILESSFVDPTLADNWGLEKFDALSYEYFGGHRTALEKDVLFFENKRRYVEWSKARKD